MTILKTFKAFFTMLIIMFATMFYTPAASAVPMASAEYHAYNPDSGFMGVSVAAPLGIGALCLAAFYRLALKAYPDGKNTDPANLQMNNKLTGGDDDQEEITALGGGVAFRQYG